MEMDPQERESDLGADDSPVSHNEEDMSDGDGESGREHDDSCDEIRRHAGGLLADHGDVLAKLKMQVRDIKDDFENGRHLNFPALTNRSLQDTFHLPAPFPFPHPNTPFMTPLLPPPTAPSSGSSHSSEGSASSQHTWSFEEQFKQVRQLYEINDDPKRKEFLDDLFSFMQKRGTPINRLPIMAKSVLDLFELYNLVIARGGLVDVINKKLWQEIIKGLHLPSSITSAAFTLRTQYMKYLYPYECDKRRLSTPSELQAAIDGNRREGRRSSYGQYESMGGGGHHHQQRSPNPSQMSPLSLVSQQQQLAARMNMLGGGGALTLHNGVGGPHHPTHPQPLGQPMNGGPLPGMAPSEFEARMIDYFKLLNKEIRGQHQAMTMTPPRQGEESPPGGGGGGGGGATSPLTQQQRMTLWNLYNNNQSPVTVVEPQKEALNLSEPPAVKREPDGRESPPPAKKFGGRSAEDGEEEGKSGTPATHIKINSRGDSRNGGDSNSLVVSMELNGITYEGVLFAQSPPSGGRAALAS